MEYNLWKSTQELTLDVNSSLSTMCCDIKKIWKVSNLGVSVPPVLSKNKEDHIASLLLRQRNDPFPQNIITSDKEWFFYDDVQYKMQEIDKDECRVSRKKSYAVCKVG